MNRKIHARRWWWVIALVLIAALALAACGGDDDDAADDGDDTTVEDSPSLDGGPAIDAGGAGGAASESQLPGCIGGEDDECPAPLSLPLDGTATLDTVAIMFPARYFESATPDDADDPRVVISPSEANKFEEKATFELHYAESVAAALDELSDPETASWQTEVLGEGTVAVQRDDTQDPPITTTIGAFELDDGRALVLRAATTGKYGWDLYHLVYEAMLDSITLDG